MKIFRQLEKTGKIITKISLIYTIEVVIYRKKADPYLHFHWRDVTCNIRSLC